MSRRGLVATAAALALLPVGAAAHQGFQFFQDRDNLVGMGPGPDGFIGTEDDEAIAVPQWNFFGSLSYFRFTGLPDGQADFTAFPLSSGFMQVADFIVTGGFAAVRDFDVFFRSVRTDGVEDRTVDRKILPHQLVVMADRSTVAELPLRICLDMALTECVDVEVTPTGGTAYNRNLMRNPFTIPGLSPELASYFLSVLGRVPAGWTQVSVLELPATPLTAENTSGPRAAGFLGGSVEAVIVFWTFEATPGPDTPPPCVNFVHTDADADRDGVRDGCECGDGTADGFVDHADAALVQSCTVGQVPCPLLCDVTGDGICNTLDARIIDRFADGELDKDALTCAAKP